MGKVSVKILSAGNIKFINKMGPIKTPISIDENVAQRLKAMGYAIQYVDPINLTLKRPKQPPKIKPEPRVIPEKEVEVKIPDIIPENEIPSESLVQETKIEELEATTEKEVTNLIEEVTIETSDKELETELESVDEKEKIEEEVIGNSIDNDEDNDEVEIDLDKLTKKELLELADEYDIIIPNRKKIKITDLRELLDKEL